MTSIKVYVHPQKEADSLLFDLNMEQELNIPEGIEFDDWIVQNVQGLTVDSMDYLCDLEQHYLCYFCVEDSQAFDELFILLEKRLQLKVN